jgi:formamidopyrimidine-DNA glycosylase
MPELPDAVVYERRIASGALDREISGTTVVDPLILGDGTEPHRLDEVLTGRRLMDTYRHGKHVFVRYGDERCPDTGVPLETETVSGRTAYVSPARQPPPE